MNKYLITLMLLSITTLLKAQDTNIEPSQLAKSYLQNKNMMVDYSTGIFNYKVPVYEINTGDYTLPISLDYSARGVKAIDEPGILGYNWNLNIGGIVTRTVRGGIPDEVYPEGYIHHKFISSLRTEQVDSVNKRLIDGESDIFTAIFNGQNVHFIIKYDYSNEKIITESLEKTNVKIECIYDKSKYDIKGWKITDEKGNIYTYLNKEFSTGLFKKSVIAYNNLSLSSTENNATSWLLSDIKPLNSKKIKYNYDETEYNIINYKDNIHTLIKYGSPIIEIPFDKSALDGAVEDAEAVAKIFKQYLTTVIISLQACHSEYVYENGYWYNNPAYPQIKEQINKNLNALIQLDKCANISNPGNPVIDQTTQNLLFSTLTNPLFIGEKLSECASEYSTKTPILKSIEVGDISIHFNYLKSGQTESQRLFLHNINVKKNECVVSNMKLMYSTNSIGEIYYCSGNNTEFNVSPNEVFDRISFEYYRESKSKLGSIDLWGFYKGKNTGEYDYLYDFKDNVNIEYARYNSLKQIKKPNNFRVNLNYESNGIIINNENSNQIKKQGGIRIKDIIIEDNNTTDSIKYTYPQEGLYLDFTMPSNVDIINYLHMSPDSIYYNRIKDKNRIFKLDNANNGIYYPIVDVEFAGKGHSVFYFYPFISNAYWLKGVPLLSAYYSKNKILKSIEKYTYYIGEYDIEVNSSPFFDKNTEHRFNKLIEQIPAYDYYVDIDKLDTEKKEGRIGNSFFNNLYDNIAARRYVISPNLNYNIRYGGKILLKEMAEYKFEADNLIYNTDIVFDMINTTMPFTKEQYFYDNVESIYPTRIEKTNSNGSKDILVTKRSCDFQDSNSVIAQMKSLNMNSYPIKEQKLTKNINDEDYCLLEDRFYNFEMKSKDVVLNKIYYYNPSDKILLNEVLNNNNFFLSNQDKYSIEQSIEYYSIEDPLNHSIEYIPKKVSTLKEDFVFVYNNKSNDLIFKGSNCKLENVDILDIRYNRARNYLNVSPANTNQYRLYAYTTSTVSMPCIIEYDNNAANSDIVHLNLDKPNQLHIIDITINLNKELTGIKINNIDQDKITYLALVPTDVEFEATSYHPDGTIFFKFNQNGQMERYEYDAARRPIKIFDQNKNLLMEMKYNKVLN